MFLLLLLLLLLFLRSLGTLILHPHPALRYFALRYYVIITPLLFLGLFECEYLSSS